MSVVLSMPTIILKRFPFTCESINSYRSILNFAKVRPESMKKFEILVERLQDEVGLDLEVAPRRPMIRTH